MKRGKCQNHTMPVCVHRHILPLYMEDALLLFEGDAVLGREANRKIQPVTVPGPRGTTGL